MINNRHYLIDMTIVVDYDGNIYMGGIRFGNWGGTEMDFHLVKYNANGDTIYTRDILPGHEYLHGLDIDNFGNTYLVGHANVKGVGIFGPGYMNTNTVYVAKFNTGSTTRKRPTKPLIERTFIACSGNNLPILSAKGNNINWYKDSLLVNLIASSNSYQPDISKTDTFYVTQTVNNIPSWPKQIIVYISTLSGFSIEYRDDSLFAPKSLNYTYQWYFDSIPMADSIGGKQQSIKASNTGSYKVIVGDNEGCSKEASYSYSVSPLKDLKFTVSIDGSSGILHWEIAKEADIKNFELEKSSDGIEFKKLTYINRVDDSTTGFSYTDRYLFKGDNYYRLKIFSKNGSITYSKVIALANKKEKPLQISPNPVGNELKFSLAAQQPSADYKIKIFETNGNLLYNGIMNINNSETKELKVDFLRAGMYFLELFDGKNKYVALFIKQ